jgi:hypothetical protein
VDFFNNVCGGVLKRNDTHLKTLFTKRFIIKTQTSLIGFVVKRLFFEVLVV